MQMLTPKANTDQSITLSARSPAFAALPVSDAAMVVIVKATGTRDLSLLTLNLCRCNFS